MTGEFPAQMASNAEMFPFDDITILRMDFLCLDDFHTQKNTIMTYELQKLLEGFGIHIGLLVLNQSIDA